MNYLEVYVEGQLESIAFRALVDTGSTYCLIPRIPFFLPLADDDESQMVRSTTYTTTGTMETPLRNFYVYPKEAHANPQLRALYRKKTVVGILPDLTPEQQTLSEAERRNLLEPILGMSYLKMVSLSKPVGMPIELHP